MGTNEPQTNPDERAGPPARPQNGREPVEQSLERIEQRLDRLEASISRLTHVLDQAPMMMASFTDVADTYIHDAAEEGVDVDARMRQLARVVGKATDPRVLDALETLVEHGDDIQTAVGLLDGLPDSFATVVDVIDAAIARAAENGIDVVELGRMMANGSSQLARFVQSTEFRTLIESGVLDPIAIETVGQVGEALASAKRGGDVRGVGVFGLMGAMRDDDVRRALGFAVEFGRRFGAAIDNGTRQLPE